MSEGMSGDEIAERMRLATRAPYDRAAELLGQAIRHADKAVEELKRAAVGTEYRVEVRELQNGLNRLERSILTAGEIRAKYAAKSLLRQRQSKEQRICFCAVFDEPHLHGAHEPDEVAP